MITVVIFVCLNQNQNDYYYMIHFPLCLLRP